MGKWLNALRQAEKNTKTTTHPTDKTDKTASDEVLSVLSALPPAAFAKIPDRWQAATALDARLAGEPDSICSEWRRNLGALDAYRPPSGFPAPWWRGIIRDAELFLSTWGKQAADLGWTTLDLFGVHPKAPAARFSCMGLLLLVNGGRVVAITTETGMIEQQSGARLTYTRRPPDTECVALWDLSS
jgi:hypothetical protein